jgi:hypothetical protein
LYLAAPQAELDPSTVAAMGVPLTLTMFSPLWLVNATNVAVDAAVVLFRPGRQVPSCCSTGLLLARRLHLKGGYVS